MAKRKDSSKYFDYGTGSAPKFAKKKPREKKARDRKAASRKGAETRKRNKFNKAFDYGGSVLAAPIESVAKVIVPSSGGSLFKGVRGFLFGGK